ncbi:hypothetical protein GCM10009676_02450 [Prauserella halophila]|uniref:Uncharacterized protein n=1 Tax=Prauserella halophila TaxID=185641 RepID=A0ABP4GIN7_9PSEU
MTGDVTATAMRGRPVRAGPLAARRAAAIEINRHIAAAVCGTVDSFPDPPPIRFGPPIRCAVHTPDTRFL